MQVRVNFGTYKGEIREFPFHIATVMLSDGRASRVDEVKQAVEQPKVEEPKVVARKRR